MIPPSRPPFQFGLGSLMALMAGAAIVVAIVAGSFFEHAAYVVLALEGLVGWWAFMLADNPR